MRYWRYFSQAAVAPHHENNSPLEKYIIKFYFHSGDALDMKILLIAKLFTLNFTYRED